MLEKKINQKNIYIETLGCFKNQYDSEIMLSSLKKRGFNITNDAALADVLLINTCAFLSSAVYESIQRILVLSEYKKSAAQSSVLKPAKKLVVAGCLAERYRDKLLKEVPQIDALMGTADYTKISSLIHDLLFLEQLDHLKQVSFIHQQSQKRRFNWQNVTPAKTAINQQHYRFLKIAEGCSNGCSFCNIPKLRGKQASRPAAQVLNEFNHFLAWGTKEINLIAQNSSSYGFDLEAKQRLDLAQLVDYLLTEHLKKNAHADYWLRIFYSYPNDYPLKLQDLMQQYSQHLVPYVDMPFQHIDDRILKKMNRKITGEEIKRLLDKMLGKNPALSLRSTFIVGFPSESEADFQKLYDFVATGIFTHIGVFTYFAEDNIAANKYKDDVPQAVKKTRQGALLKLQKKITTAKNRLLNGSVLKILVDKQTSAGSFQGRSIYQAAEVDGIVNLKHNQHTKSTPKVGQFCMAKVVSNRGYDLTANII